MNWGVALADYPVPEDMPGEYMEIIKQEMRDHVSKGGHSKDEASKKMFVKYCNIVGLFKGIKIDWDKTAEEHLEEAEQFEGSL